MDYDTKLINLALDAGELMLASGAETFRVQDTMLRILSTTGREKVEALAMGRNIACHLSPPQRRKPRKRQRPAALR